MSGTGDQGDRGQRRVHQRRTAGGVLRPHGRREHRPQGVHRRLLRKGDLRQARRRARDAGVPAPRHRRLVRDHHLADPRPQRLRRRDRRGVFLVGGAPGTGRAAALQRVPPGLQDARRAADAAGHPQPSPADRPRPRAAPRLHRQRARSRGSDHDLPELWQGRRGAGLVRDALVPARRHRGMRALWISAARTL